MVFELDGYGFGEGGKRRMKRGGRRYISSGGSLFSQDSAGYKYSQPRLRIEGECHDSCRCREKPEGR